MALFTFLSRRLQQPRRLLVALSALALLALATILTVHAHLLYQRALDRATLELTAHLAMLAEQTETKLGSAAVLLSELQRVAPPDAPVRAPLAAPLREALRLAEAGLPEISGVHLVDREGRLVFSTNGQADGRSVGDREYFQAHRAGEERYIGPPVLGRLTTQAVVPMSVRLSDHSGEFAGVAVASLSLRRFEAFYERLSRHFDLQVAMVLRDGRVIAAAPKLQTMPTRVDPKRLAARVGGQSHGEFRGRSPADGREKVFVFRSLQGWPVVLFLGLDHGRLLEGLYPQFARHALVWALFAVFTVLGVRRLLRQMDLLAQGRAELRQAYVTMKTMAGTDELTGLPNRRRFSELARQELQRGWRHGDRAALLLLDVDRFKQVNDQLGHDVGDAALVAVAQVIQRTLRDSDLTCRWGGEEFAVLFVKADREQALEAAHRLREAVVAQTLVPMHPALRVTFSGGLAVWDGPFEPLDALVKRADDALYRAKTGGRNRICIGGADIPSPALRAKEEADEPTARHP